MEAYDILQAVESNTGARVLATVIHVEGHAYRKQGAVMLLMADGSMVGSISPGCLEGDLAAYVPSVWESQKPQMVEYDMRPADDFGWGETIGCGGLIRILLEPLAGELLVNLLVVKNKLDQGETVELIRTYTDGYSDIRYALRGSGVEEQELAASSAVRESFHVVTSTVFVPKPRVIIFGANLDAIPLVQMAANSGFRVVVTDWREAVCQAERFPGVETMVAFPETLVKKLALNERDYVVIMSHQFEKDTAFLQGVMAYPLQYLGIMGSKERTSKMLDGFERPDWLHAPIGLNIGSEGAFENAISIAAELIAIKRGKHGAGSWRSPVAHGRDVQSFCSW
ncbi:XdhC family protein [Paenibacillus qinlingensis]|uniref:Xanthine dehydrogenase accessory factor n=1 Tax=Paenibacillus qinlingensis TaxID=1837343 RepID=A0ABU1P5Z3_9BACL|nr:XdhC family protein [Paenibacillus qinlingensis]MDR6554612.1 xanthine dehydrogenase accessory factor [Paenibacillus qinlingensis]